jgi:hypothetical protein
MLQTLQTPHICSWWDCFKAMNRSDIIPRDRHLQSSDVKFNWNNNKFRSFNGAEYTTPFTKAFRYSAILIKMMNLIKLAHMMMATTLSRRIPIRFNKSSIFQIPQSDTTTCMWYVGKHIMYRRWTNYEILVFTSANSPIHKHNSCEMKILLDVCAFQPYICPSAFGMS